MPHVIVADDAFEAGRHLIKPYKPSSKRDLTTKQKSFNKRLSRLEKRMN